MARKQSTHTAGQEGRPIHPTEWKDTTTERLKRELGWGASYIADGDEESERLFNFGILAPPVDATPIDPFSCFDSRFAGAGSPRVEQGARPELLGHGKRLYITHMV